MIQVKIEGNDGINEFLEEELSNLNEVLEKSITAIAGSSVIKDNDIIFLPISTFVDVSNPTKDEVLTVANGLTNVKLYSNGTENEPDTTSLFVWYIGTDGKVLILKTPSSAITHIEILPDTLDTYEGVIEVGLWPLFGNAGSGIVYTSTKGYLKNDLGEYIPLAYNPTELPSIINDFIAKFVCLGDVTITCISTELFLKDNIGGITPYVSGDIIPAGEYIIYGKEVDNIRFNNDSFDSVNIIRNSKQTDATDMFFDLTTLRIFEAEPTTFGNVTNFTYAWSYCNSLIAFPMIDTSKGTNFEYTWEWCETIKEFPLIDTSNGTNFRATWSFCYLLESFPLLDVSKATAFYKTWSWCSSLTSFPMMDTSNVLDFYQAWNNCINLTSFPLIDTSNGTILKYAWYGCSSLTSFPFIDTSSCTSFYGAWDGCSSLTSFPLLDSSNVTSFRNTWSKCSSLISFPLIDTSNGYDFTTAWSNCSSLISFPVLNLSKGQYFQHTWGRCTSLTKLPLLDFTTGTNISYAFYYCTGLVCIDGIINDGLNTPTNTAMFTGCDALLRPNLTEQADIENGIDWINDTEC